MEIEKYSPSTYLDLPEDILLNTQHELQRLQEETSQLSRQLLDLSTKLAKHPHDPQYQKEYDELVQVKETNKKIYRSLSECVK